MVDGGAGKWLDMSHHRHCPRHRSAVRCWVCAEVVSAMSHLSCGMLHPNHMVSTTVISCP